MDNSPETRRLSPAVISVIVIALVALSSGAVYVVTQPIDTTSTVATSSSTTQDSTTTPSTDTSTDSTSNDTSTNATSTTGTYIDGTYTNTASYYTPDGSEDIKVSVMLSNNTITSVSIVNSGYDHESVRYQERFEQAYESYVTGKSIDSLQLSRVAGASLTTEGFNSAIEAIKNDAKA